LIIASSLISGVFGFFSFFTPGLAVFLTPGDFVGVSKKTSLTLSGYTTNFVVVENAFPLLYELFDFQYVDKFCSIFSSSQNMNFWGDNIRFS